MKQKKYSHLTREERHVFFAYLKDGLSLRAIEAKLGRKASGLCREIKENSKDGTRESYEPDSAHFQSQFRKWDANRRKPLKCREVIQYVLEKLEEDWSPVQIDGRIKQDYPNDLAMRISHETVYQFINSEEGKELALVKHLRHGKLRRHKKKKNRPIDPKKQAIPNRISIAERPSIVDKKKRFGDWESDSMIGTLKKGAILTIQKERRSQYACLKKLPDKTAHTTTEGIIHNLRWFPQSLLRTITFDNGRENTEHEKLKKEFGMDTYFCDAYCSWQKGSVENVIGLIRQYIPKGQCINDLSDADIQQIQDKLNNRPRKCLGFRTPKEVLSKHLKKLGVQLPT